MSKNFLGKFLAKDFEPRFEGNQKRVTQANQSIQLGIMYIEIIFPMSPKSRLVI